MRTRSGKFIAFCSKSCLLRTCGRTCLKKANGVKIKEFVTIGVELGGFLHIGSAVSFNATPRWVESRQAFWQHSPKTHHLSGVAQTYCSEIPAVEKAQFSKARIVQSLQRQHGLRLSLPMYTCRTSDDDHFFNTVLFVIFINTTCKATSQSSKLDEF